MKIIATDLDGTLFYPKDKIKVIPKKNLYFIQSFIDNGGKLCVVSGRSHSFGLKVKEIINRDIDIITYNGASIYKGDEVIYSHPLDNKEIASIIDDVFNSYKIMAAIIFTDEGIYLRGKKIDSKMTRFLGSIYLKGQGNYAEDAHLGKGEYSNALENSKIYKVLLLFGVSFRARKKALETNKVLRNTYQNIESSWTSNCIEITAKNISKGDAVKRYAEILGVDPKDVYVVGDSGNDISMFKEFSENSFVMAHASKVVKKYAKYQITKYEDLSRYIYEK